MKQEVTFHYFVVSDSIGETGLAVARSALTQFPKVKSMLHSHTFITSEEGLIEVLDEALELDAFVFGTITSPQLMTVIDDYEKNKGLIFFDILGPIIQQIGLRTGNEPMEIPGAEYQLTDKYFSRIKAMEFCIAYDDGKDPTGFYESDIIILGVSRTGKTPLSMYLANEGYKVSNLPIIPETDLPEELFKIDRKRIIGLTNEPESIQGHRLNRMREYGMPETSRYASLERAQEEIAFSDELYRRLAVPVINVHNRSIEETASLIIQILNLKPL